ncbi:MAG TPA: gamma-glutamyl-gamma-aminobutyrate hydrolase family protein [Chloroflexota bacterium]|jgi:putative glutamine amidotransferase|nr:gamma-glutamyl-gamma-aminobutyrate hydrolase family protein [Chloroflexota bacterium]
MTSTQRPLIGITIAPPETGGPFLQQRATYPRAIASAGGLPVLIPPLDSETLTDLLERLDGVVFPGGADVNPDLYDQPREPKTEVVDELDVLEMDVARWALETQIPMLGICRGQQLLNVALGGSLVQHVDAHRQPGDRQALTEGLQIEPGSRLADVFGTTQTPVNHMHHQAVREVGQGLKAVAWAPDGTIEGLESLDGGHPWLLTVQFHPEELFGFHTPSQRLFEAFVQACRVRIPAARLALR